MKAAQGESSSRWKQGYLITVLKSADILKSIFWVVCSNKFYNTLCTRDFDYLIRLGSRQQTT